MEQYYKEGTIQITADLELKDFTWQLESIHWHISTRKLTLEVLMWEKHLKHSRSFTFDVPEGVKVPEPEPFSIQLLLQMPQFIGSELV